MSYVCNFSLVDNKVVVLNYVALLLDGWDILSWSMYVLENRIDLGMNEFGLLLVVIAYRILVYVNVLLSATLFVLGFCLILIFSFFYGT